MNLCWFRETACSKMGGGGGGWWGWSSLSLGHCFLSAQQDWVRSLPCPRFSRSRSPAQQLQGLQKGWVPHAPHRLVPGPDSGAHLSDLFLPFSLPGLSTPTPGSLFLSEAFSCHQHRSCRDVCFCCFKKNFFLARRGLMGCLLGLHSPAVGCGWGCV